MRKYIQLKADLWRQCNECFGYFLKEQVCSRGRCIHCCLEVCVEEDLADLDVEAKPLGGQSHPVHRIVDDLKEAGAKPGEIDWLVKLAGAYATRHATEKLTRRVNMKARKEIAKVLHALADCYETIETKFLPLQRLAKKKKEKR